MLQHQPVQRRDALGDRHPEPAAALGLAVGAVETLAQAGQRLGIQRRAGVVHLQAVGIEAQRDGTALGRVAHGVVDQVAQQQGQQVGVAVQRERRLRRGRPVAAERDVAAFGQRQHVAEDLHDDGLPVHRRRVRRTLGGLQPRQGQQLPDQAVHAVEAGHQLGSGLRALRGVGSAVEHVPLRTQHGQRRAQLVRGIGREAALARQRGVDAGKEAVHRPQQRLQLGRRVGQRHRLQVVGAAALHVGRERAHRRQRLPHGPGHRQQQHRQHQQPGQQLAAHQVAHELVALVHALPGGHQGAAVGGLQVVGAPGRARELQVDEAHGVGPVRQRLALAVDQQRAALGVPDGDGHVVQVGFALGGGRRRQPLHRRGRPQPARRGLHLARQPDEFGVEEFVDLDPCAVGRHQQRHAPDQRRAGQQVQQQPALQAQEDGPAAPSA